MLQPLPVMIQSWDAVVQNSLLTVVEVTSKQVGARHVVVFVGVLGGFSPEVPEGFHLSNL